MEKLHSVLLEKMRQRNVLYDPLYQGAAYTKLREAAWDEVSRSMNVTVETCKKLWEKLLRNFIATCVKSRDIPSSSAVSVAYDQMGFLLPFVDDYRRQFLETSQDTSAPPSGGNDLQAKETLLCHLQGSLERGEPMDHGCGGGGVTEKEDDEVRCLTARGRESREETAVDVDVVDGTARVSRWLDESVKNRLRQEIEEEQNGFAEEIREHVNRMRGHSAGVQEQDVVSLMSYSSKSVRRPLRERREDLQRHSHYHRGSSASNYPLFSEGQRRNLETLTGTSLVAQGEFDEVDIFFLSMARMAKKFSERDQSLVKMKLNAIVMEALMRDNEGL